MPTGKLGECTYTHMHAHATCDETNKNQSEKKKKVNIGETIIHPVGLELAKRVGIYIPR